MAADGGNAEEAIAKFARAGIDCDKLATDLQREATEAFVRDWNEMLAPIASKSAAPRADRWIHRSDGIFGRVEVSPIIRRDAPVVEPEADASYARALDDWLHAPRDI